MRQPFFYLATLALLGSVQFSTAQERSPIYPFDVTTGDETAKIEGAINSAIFAKLKKPVTDKAEFVLDVEPQMIIVNVFATDAKGALKKDTANKPQIIMVQKGDRFSLDKTMDKKPVLPGTYLMNIVATDKGTARVLFEVTAGESKTEKPEEKSEDKPAEKKTPTASPTTAIQATPDSAVAAIFDCAKSGDLKDLKQLLPPGDIADRDVKKLCAIGDKDKDDQDEFRNFFKAGKVNGKPIIKEDKAFVDFLFGKDGKRQETMSLIRIDGKWYLKSF